MFSDIQSEVKEFIEKMEKLSGKSLVIEIKDYCAAPPGFNKLCELIAEFEHSKFILAENLQTKAYFNFLCKMIKFNGMCGQFLLETLHNINPDDTEKRIKQCYKEIVDFLYEAKEEIGQHENCNKEECKYEKNTVKGK